MIPPSSGQGQDTYRELIGRIRPAAGYWRLEGRYHCLDSLNRFQVFHYSLVTGIAGFHQIHLVDPRGDSLRFTGSGRILTLGSSHPLSGYDQMALVSIYWRLSWFLRPENWDVMVRQCSFELEDSDDDSVMVLSLASTLTHPARLRIHYRQSDWRLLKIESYSGESLQDILEFTMREESRPGIFMPPDLPGQYSFFELGGGESERIDPLLVAGLRPLKSVKGGFGLMHQYLGEQDGLQILAFYFNGTQTLLAVYNPVVQRELTEVGAIEYRYQFPLHRIFQFRAQDVTFYWVGGLRSEDIQAIKDQYRYKLRVSGSGQYHFTAGRIGLAVLLSALLIIIFLRTGRKRSHS